MHINEIDLNLLRVFDAVYRARNVSRAAESLDLTQPAVSQGLTRLRLLIKDPLFMRGPGGVQPSPKADQLAPAVRLALGTLEQALSESVEFDPLKSGKTFRIHMSDIGEGRFLPDLMVALRERAPGVRIETAPLPAAAITDALDSGRTDFAFGFLPTVKDTQSVQLLKDRYIVLLRQNHPFAAEFNMLGDGPAMLEKLQDLEFVAGRTHSDTLRILQMLQLEDRVRLTVEHFMVLPAIVRATNLGVVMPHNIAKSFSQAGGYVIIEPPFPLRDFTVSLHWSRRFESDPGNRWLRQTLVDMFAVT